MMKPAILLLTLFTSLAGCSQPHRGPSPVADCKAAFPELCYNCGGIEEMRRFETGRGSKEFRLNHRDYYLTFERLNRASSSDSPEYLEQRYGYPSLDYYYFFKRPNTEDGLKCVVMYQTEVNEPMSVDGAACRIYQQDPILDTLFKELPSSTNRYIQIKCYYQTMLAEIKAREQAQGSNGDSVLPDDHEFYPEFEPQFDVIQTVWSNENYWEDLILAYPHPGIYYHPNVLPFGEKDISIYYQYGCNLNGECLIE